MPIPESKSPTGTNQSGVLYSNSTPSIPESEEIERIAYEAFGFQRVDGTWVMNAMNFEKSEKLKASLTKLVVESNERLLKRLEEKQQDTEDGEMVGIRHIKAELNALKGQT